MRWHKGWIVLDFMLATLIAVLGNIVASYLQERFTLTDPARFIFVALVFVVCLGVLLYVTVERSRTSENQSVPISSERRNQGVTVNQRVKKLFGKLVGFNVERISEGDYEVFQEVRDIGDGGEATGFKAKEVSGGKLSTNQTASKVGKGATVTGVEIDNDGL